MSIHLKAVYGLIGLVISIIVFFIYSPALQSPFLYDDAGSIRRNAAVRMTSITIPQLLKAIETSRPMAQLSFALNYYQDGYAVRNYHLVNILIHLINGFLLFFLIKTMMNSLGSDFQHSVLTALSCALIWLVNPIQTQAVTYIVQRMTSLAAMFYLISMLLYALGRSSNRKWISVIFFIGCTLSGLLALGTKEISITLPLFIMLYELYFHQNLKLDWILQHRYLIGVMIIFFISISFFLLPVNLLEFLTKGYDNFSFNMKQRLLTEFRVVIYYISLIFFPHPARLKISYTFPLSYSFFNPLVTLFAICALLCMLSYAFCTVKKYKLISFCIFWFCGNLIVESSIIPLHLVFEHRIYLPSMFLILLGILLLKSIIKQIWLRSSALIIIVLLLSMWTYQRNIIWSDELVFWEDCLIKTPGGADIHRTIGIIMAKRKQFKDAAQCFYESNRIKPNNPQTHNNLGRLFAAQGLYLKAAKHYSIALALKPDFLEANNGLGNVLLKSGKINEAMQYYLRTLEINPDFAATHFNLGNIWARQAKITKAMYHFSEALRCDPEYEEAQNNLQKLKQIKNYYQKGLNFMKKDQSEEAITMFEHALKLNPAMLKAMNQLAFIHAKSGRLARSREFFQKMLRINPQMPNIYFNIACLYAREKKVDTAIEWLYKAIEEGYSNWDAIKTDPDLENIRKTGELKAFIK